MQVRSIREAAIGLVGCGAGDQADGASRDFRVVLIREGLAKSGVFYTRRVVEEIAAAAEGLRAFADHPTPSEDRERPVRSVRDVVGFYKEASARVDPETGLVQAEAVLHVFESAAWLAEMAREVLSVGPPTEVIGLSIDAVCELRQGRPAVGGSRVVEGVRLVALKSVDVVTRAGAGGKFVQVQESENGMNGQMGDGAGMNDISETGGAAQAGGAAGAALRAAERVLAEARDAQAVVTETSALVREQQDRVRSERLELACAEALVERLERVALPGPVEKRVRQQWVFAPGRWESEEDYVRALEAAIDLEVATLGELRDMRLLAPEDGGASERSASPVTGMGDQRVDVTLPEADKQRLVAQIAMDRLFGLEGGEETNPQELASGGGQERRAGETREDAAWRRARQHGLVAGAPRWRGIREAYVALTGDALVSGALYPEGSIVREANEVTTGVLNQALLNSMTKRLVRDYRGQPQDWRKFCEVVPLDNFKSQDRVRLHDFASLATVAEGAAYANLGWDDSRETYAPAKRGNLVVVTREAILNDDLRAIRKIPDKLARAAYITLNEFVYGLFTTNPAMNDGSKVFDDGVQATHGNRGTTALSSAAVQAAITAMMKQTDSAGKRLSLKPRYLLVPSDLYFTSLTIVNSTMVPGSNNNDVNVLRGVLEPIPVAQFTDVTDYYLICDPKDIESIEIGFVGGKEEPELLMQDAPLLGQVFTNDQMTFKVRWEFGGGWLDYRGAFWGNVAG